MASKIAEAFVEIQADLKKLRADMKVVRKVTEDGTKQAGKAAEKNFLGAFAKIGTAIFALKKAFDFAIEAKNLARDAEEIGSKYATVFEGIEDKGESAARSLAENFGLANSTAQKLLGTTGDLLTGFKFTDQQALDLSVKVNELAVDLASFSNIEGGATRASEALTKALLGETESAKSLGIVIRQDTKEFKNQVATLQRTQGLTLAQAKALVILEQATSQSTKAIGDFERTQGSLANQERITSERLKEFKEELGKGIIPTVQESLKFFNSLFNSLTQGNVITDVFVGTVKTLATAFIGLVSGIKVVGTLIGGLFASAVAASTLEFSKAGDILSRTWDKVKSDSLDAGDSISNIWSKTANDYQNSGSQIAQSNTEVSESAKKAAQNIQSLVDVAKKLRATREDLTGISPQAPFLEEQEGGDLIPQTLEQVEQLEKPILDIGKNFGVELIDGLQRATSASRIMSSILGQGSSRFLSDLTSALNVTSQIVALINTIGGFFNSGFSLLNVVGGFLGGGSSATAAVSPTAAINQGFQGLQNSIQAQTASNAAFSQPTEIVVQLGNREIGRVLVDEINNVNQEGFKVNNT